MNLHQEETRTPRGVHCLQACLLQSREVTPKGAPSPSQQNVALACLFATPAKHHWVKGPADGLPFLPPSLNVSEVPVAQGNGSFGCWVTYHLAHGRLTHIQRMLVWKPAPLLSSTAHSKIVLLFIRWSIRYYNQDTPAGGNPGLICNLPCPFYTADALLGCPQQRWIVRQI